MKGDALPPFDHVLRHCRQADLKTEPDGTIIGVFPHAFEPDQDGVSVTWLEHFGGATPAEHLNAARTAMSTVRRLRKSNRLAKLQVGKVINAGATIDRPLTIIHDPIDEPPDKLNTGHSLITGIASGDDDLRNRIAMTVAKTDLELAMEE